MKIVIRDIDVRVETEFSRSGELKKKYDKIYISLVGESVFENLMNRRRRPHTEYKKHVIPQLMERLKEDQPNIHEILKDVKWGWNQYCGCSVCACSPGFVGNVKRDYPNNVYSIFVSITID